MKLPTLGFLKGDDLLKAIMEAPSEDPQTALLRQTNIDATAIHEFRKEVRRQTGRAPSYAAVGNYLRQLEYERKEDQS